MTGGTSQLVLGVVNTIFGKTVPLSIHKENVNKLPKDMCLHKATMPKMNTMQM